MKKNILFVNLPSMPFEDIASNLAGEDSYSQPISMPLGILYLSSYLKKHNEFNNVGLLDYVLKICEIAKYKKMNAPAKLEEFIVNVAQRDAGFTPDILAFSLIFSTSHPFFIICNDLLRSLWPNAVSVVGGTHATNCTKRLLENKNVDYVVRGEGEIVFSEFIKQFSGNGPINIKGIYSKEKIASNSCLYLCDPCEQLDDLPFPDWELIDMEAYLKARGRKQEIGALGIKKIASIMTTRGCPFGCTFCSSRTVHGRVMRFRSTENVTEEIKILNKRYGVSLFIPEDDLFTANRKKVLKLLEALRGLNIPDFELQFPNALNVNTLSEEIIDGLIKAGMRIATIAIESGSEYVQKYIIKKNCNIKKAKEIIKYLKGKGIIVWCYFILGFPGETKEQMLETIEYAKSMGSDWCVFNLAIPLIGTEMYDTFIQAGCIKDDLESWSNSFFPKRTFDTNEILAGELEELAYRANLECNFINNRNKVDKNFGRAIEIYEDIVRAYPFHIIGLYCIMECKKQMGHHKEAERINKEMNILIKSDKRASKMYEKYKDLMPEFKMEAMTRE